MCSLCGVLGGRGHWTDTSSNPDAFRAAAPTTIAGEQQARTTLVNKVLKHYGLALSDWAPGSFMLRSHTGQTVLVNNLTEVWAAAESMSKKECDPLDAELLDGLERGAAQVI